MMVKKYKILHIPTSTFMMSDDFSYCSRVLYYNQEERRIYNQLFEKRPGIKEIKESDEATALEIIKKIVDDYRLDTRFNNSYSNELFYCLVEIFEENNIC